MKKNYLFSLITAILLFACLIISTTPDLLEAKGSFGGGRSFGGGSRSFGGSRSARPSYSKPSTPSKPTTSFGSSRQSTSPAPRAATSFGGGTRMSSGSEYTQKYGTPRRTDVMSRPNGSGGYQNYSVHNYGGYGSGLMTGYMMGSTSWMWGMPFHPAFYYSRPYYVQNPDGTMDVYPPTFSFTKLIFTLIVLGAIVFIIYVIIRNRRRGRISGGSFS